MMNVFTLRNAAIAAVATITLAAAGFAEPDQQTPAPMKESEFRLLHAERFQLEQAYQHVWRRDMPRVDSGWLLVLEADSERIRLRQGIEPVLYVGGQTAERVNSGRFGRVIAIVPGDFELSDAPIFLGPEALPEKLTPAAIAAAFADAVAEGIAAPAAETILDVTVAETGSYPTDYELRQRAIDLVEDYSPQEQDLIRSWRLPRVK